ncbi:MAG: hypothetical protein ACTSPA_13965 [Promethearchaeota archaeon]
MILQMDLFGPLIMIILIILGIIFIFLSISTLFMKWALSITDGENRDFFPVFLTTFICLIIGDALPCCGCFIAPVIIQSRHKLDYGKSFLTYILASLLPFLIAVIIIILIFLPEIIFF